MKLGTETVSVVNHIYSQPEPEIGMGATVLSWTDRYAATVTAWDARKGIIIVQADKATRTDLNGMSESQTYAYESNPDGPTYTFRLGPTGIWTEVVWNATTRRWDKVKALRLRLGERRHYHDFSF